jgi:hypothetical protein
MKKTFILLLSVLFSSTGFCQLLNDPALTITDFEKALSNSDHLGCILSKHDFVMVQGKPGKINPGSINNPLQPNLETVRSESWIPEIRNTSPKEEPVIIFIIILVEWKSGCGPYPDVIKSLTVGINQNPVYKDKVNKFFESIKENYPNKSKRYPLNNDLSRRYSDPIELFTKEDSKIGVRTILGQFDDEACYIVSFDLLK